MSGLQKYCSSSDPRFLEVFWDISENDFLKQLRSCFCVQLEGLEDELKCMHETGAGGFFQPLPLPEGMALSSSDVIASLNEHLIVALQVFFFHLSLWYSGFYYTGTSGVVHCLECIILCFTQSVQLCVSRISGNNWSDENSWNLRKGFTLCTWNGWLDCHNSYLSVEILLPFCFCCHEHSWNYERYLSNVSIVL